jgi:hypothetical protein
MIASIPRPLSHMVVTPDGWHQCAIAWHLWEGPGSQEGVRVSDLNARHAVVGGPIPGT